MVSLETTQNLINRYRDDQGGLQAKYARLIRLDLESIFTEYFLRHRDVAAFEVIFHPERLKIHWQRVDSDDHSWYDADPKTMGGFETLFPVFQGFYDAFGINRLLISFYEGYCAVQLFTGWGGKVNEG